MGIKQNKNSQRFERLGCEWYYIKKKNKDQYKNSFYTNTEKVNRMMLLRPIHKKEVSQGQAPCPHSWLGE